MFTWTHPLLPSRSLLICCSLPFHQSVCHWLLHLAKLTRLLGSLETRHLTDLPTVSLPQITPTVSALITLCVCLSFHHFFSLHLTPPFFCFQAISYVFVLHPPFYFFIISCQLVLSLELITSFLLLCFSTHSQSQTYNIHSFFLLTLASPTPHLSDIKTVLEHWAQYSVYNHSQHPNRTKHGFP